MQLSNRRLTILAEGANRNVAVELGDNVRRVGIVGSDLASDEGS